MTIPIIETLKALATPQNVAMAKSFVLSKPFGWTAGTLALGFAAYKFYNSTRGMKMRSKLASGIRDMSQKAYDNCEMIMAVEKLKPAPKKAHAKGR